jgi:hypothetical protein
MRIRNPGSFYDGREYGSSRLISELESGFVRLVNCETDDLGGSEHDPVRGNPAGSDCPAPPGGIYRHSAARLDNSTLFFILFKIRLSLLYFMSSNKGEISYTNL